MTSTRRDTSAMDELRGIITQPGTPPEAPPTGKVLPFAGVVEFCEQFCGMLEPDAPVAEVFVGTFDALTAEFTWAQGAQLRNLPPRYLPPFAEPGPWLEDYLRLESLFDHLGIRAFAPGINPAVVRRPSRAASSAELPRPATPTRGEAQPAVVEIPDIVTGEAGGPKGQAPQGKAYFLRARGGQVRLRFRVVNRPSNVPFVARVYIPWQLGGGVVQTSDVTGAPGDESASVLIPPVGYASIAVQVGPNEFEDLVGFLRPPQLGCFMLEAVPMSYVYEPPGSGSSQSHTVASQVSTTIRNFVSEESSETRPDLSPQLSDLEEFGDTLGYVGTAVAFAYPAVGEALKKASEKLDELMAMATQSTTVLHRVTEENTLLFQEMDADELTTSAHLGPGRGDWIHVLINPTFAWLAAQDEETGRVFLTVSLLSYETDGHATAEDLRLGTPPFHVIPAETRNALLEVDPLTPESQAVHPPSPDGNPAPGRFVSAGQDIAHAGGIWTTTRAQTIQRSYARTETMVKTRTRFSASKYLAYIKWGEAFVGTNTLRTIQGSGTAYAEQSTTITSVTLGSAVGEGLLMRPYYDTLYGTFAFVPLPTTGPEISGVVTGRDGQPAGGREVLLTAGLRRILARTDRSGRFQIPAGGLRAGRYLVEVEKQREAFEFRGAAMNIDIRLR